jgi:hypothetical protein
MERWSDATLIHVTDTPFAGYRKISCARWTGYQPQQNVQLIYCVRI